MFTLLKIRVIISIIVGTSIIVHAIYNLGKKDINEENEDNETIDRPNVLLNITNYIKTTVYENFIIPSNKRLQVVGKDFLYKRNTFIIGRNNKTVSIDDNGYINGVTKEDFLLYYSFNEPIVNGSYLFKDVKCFRTIDLSNMDGSKMIDASNMFENSNFEEIYFITEDGSTNSVYFDTTKILNVSKIFLNCKNLKKIKLTPNFNVGKNAKWMFKGCTNLEEVNTTLIISNEIEDIESMFEDCESL